MSSQSPRTREIPAGAHSVVFPDRCVYCEKPRETRLPLEAAVKKTGPSSTSTENVVLWILNYHLEVPYCRRCSGVSKRNEMVLRGAFWIFLLLFGGLTIALIVANWNSVAAALATAITNVPIVHVPRSTPDFRNFGAPTPQQGAVTLVNIGILIIVLVLIVGTPIFIVAVGAVLMVFLFQDILSRFDKSFKHTGVFSGHLGVGTAECSNEMVLRFANKNVAEEFAHLNQGVFKKSGEVCAPIPSVDEATVRPAIGNQEDGSSAKSTATPKSMSRKEFFVIVVIAFAVLGGVTLLGQCFPESTPPLQTSTPALPSLAQTQSTVALLPPTSPQIQPALAPLPALKCDGAKQLTSGSRADLYPRWSPDGKNIAFHSARAGNYNIWVVSSDGGWPKPLTLSSYDEGFPSWSPDGKRIVFVRFTKTVGDGLGDLYVMNADGSNEIQLTSEGTGKANVTWAPDGKSIAYSDLGTQAKPGGVIWVLDAEIKEKKKLVDYGAGGLSYNPEGTRLVFDATNPQLQRWLYVMDVQQKVVTPLIKDMDRPWFPHWSTDGNWIAFHAGQGGRDGIWIVRPDGTGRNKLVVSSEGNRFPAWSPDGKKIAFTQGQSGNAHIWTCDLK